MALAAVTGAYRAILHERGEKPTAEKVRILVPVSTRPTDAKFVMDNRISALLPYVPVELADPVERLCAIHQRVSHHRARGEAQAEKSMLEMAEALPFAVGAWAFRLAGHFPQHSVAALATNVPGPRRQLTLNKREVFDRVAAARHDRYTVDGDRRSRSATAR